MPILPASASRDTAAQCTIGDRQRHARGLFSSPIQIII
jgi:hypothetical protein